MMRFHRLRSFALALATLVVLNFAERSRAADTRVFYTPYLYLAGLVTDSGPFTIYDGQAKWIGHVVGVGSNSRGSATDTGTFYLQNRKGETLYFTYTILPTNADSTGFSRVWSGTFTITGGTGRFTGASGGGTMRRSSPSYDGLNSLIWLGDGTITY